MMKKKLKLAAAGLLVCGCLGCGIGATYSYLMTGPEEVTNSFKIGEDDTETEEDFDPDTGKKEVRIKNTGNVRCFVRARIDISDSELLKYVTYEGTDSRWELNGSDGYYYYSDTISPGESTAYLLKKVTLSDKCPDYLRDFTVNVVQESVQTQGFSDAYSAFHFMPEKDG